MSKKTLAFLLIIFLFLPVALAYGQTVTEMAARVKTVVVAVGGVIVFIGWIIAGILFLTAAGNPTKMTVARTAIFACVIGTLLIVLAQSDAILNVLKDAFGLK